MIVTTGFIEHQIIDGYLGIVSGSAVLGIGFSRDLVASIKDVLGGKVKGYEGEINEGRNIAVLSMEEEATRMGAEAVMGVSISMTVFSPSEKGTVIGVMAYGTAVRLKRNSENIAPTGCHTVGSTQAGVGFDWGK